MDLSRIPAARCAVVALMALAAAGCNTLSTGSGEGDVVAKGAGAPVSFTWQSRDGGITGDLTAVVGGASYQGRFLQITRETTSDAIGPVWGGWYGGWGGWYGGWGEPFAGPPDLPTFSRAYTGKVVATLRTGNGQSMRCRFDLAKPSTGMSGGGQGECQISDGRRIDATLDPKR